MKIVDVNKDTDKEVKEKNETPEHWKPGRVLKPGEFIAYDQRGQKIVQGG